MQPLKVIISLKLATNHSIIYLFISQDEVHPIWQEEGDLLPTEVTINRLVTNRADGNANEPIVEVVAEDFAEPTAEVVAIELPETGAVSELRRKLPSKK